MESFPENSGSEATMRLWTGVKFKVKTTRNSENLSRTFPIIIWDSFILKYSAIFLLNKSHSLKKKFFLSFSTETIN